MAEIELALAAYWSGDNPPPPIHPSSVICLAYFIYMRVGVDWRQRCKTRLSLRELDSEDTVFFLFGGYHGWRSVRSFLCGENLYSAQGGWPYHEVSIW